MSLDPESICCLQCTFDGLRKDKGEKTAYWEGRVKNILRERRIALIMHHLRNSSAVLTEDLEVAD
jgi:hypothetical protein